MKNAKKENAVETYEGLKKDYKSLKAVLTSLGVIWQTLMRSKNKCIRMKQQADQGVSLLYIAYVLILLYFYHKKMEAMGLEPMTSRV